MDQMPPSDTHAEIRAEVAKLCARFPGEYWRGLDRERAYPTEFVRALTEAGYLAALIPEEFGGAGLPLSAAAAILETIHAEGCNGAACHAQMYIMGTILRHGSSRQRQEYLPKIATGELRLQAFGVTEPTVDRHHFAPYLRPPRRRPLRGEWSESLDQPRRTLGSDAAARPHYAARAGKEADRRPLHLHRRHARNLGNSLTIRPIRTMMNHGSTEIFFDNMIVPAENLVGEEGKGFRYIIDGMNAERLLIAAECIGDAKWFISKASDYARDRVCSVGRLARTKASSSHSPGPMRRCGLPN